MEAIVSAAMTLPLYPVLRDDEAYRIVEELQLLLGHSTPEHASPAISSVIYRLPGESIALRKP